MRKVSAVGMLLMGILVLGGIASADPIPVTNGAAPIVVNFNSFTGEDPDGAPGLSAQATFSTFVFAYNAGTNQTSVSFNISLANDSTAPITSSRIGIMAFNTTPNIVKGITSGGSEFFDYVNLNKNFPYGVGKVEFCFTDGKNNCSGDAGFGADMGEMLTGSATLFFAGNISSLTFDNFYVKYQAVNCPTCDPALRDASLGGTATTKVPEPLSATLLLGSLATLGLSSRRKRNIF